MKLKVGIYNEQFRAIKPDQTILLDHKNIYEVDMDRIDPCPVKQA